MVPVDDLTPADAIGASHPPHVFRVQPIRKSSRPDQIAKHHGQVTALGSIARRILPDFARDERTRRAASHRLDRLDETLPVAQRYPELFEIAFGQLRQHISV
ncbi:MAG: hypothetical protein WA679_07935, partial [Pseudolabrys sp.]